MGEIADLIAQYGFWTVLGTAVVFILIVGATKFFEWRKEKREKKDAEDKERARAAEEAAKEEARQKAEKEKNQQMMDFLRDLIKGPKHTVEEQKQNREINQFIVKQLGCLVREGADRAYMFSFHNGGNDVLGRGFLKMSMTAEDIGTNIVPIMARYQNMPRMLFPKLYEKLVKQSTYDVMDVESIKTDDPFTYQFMIEHGAHSAIFRAIKRDDGLMIGFIGMEYIHGECVDLAAAHKNIEKKVNRTMGALLGQPMTNTEAVPRAEQ